MPHVPMIYLECITSLVSGDCQDRMYKRESSILARLLHAVAFVVFGTRRACSRCSGKTKVKEAVAIVRPATTLYGVLCVRSCSLSLCLSLSLALCLWLSRSLSLSLSLSLTRSLALSLSLSLVGLLYISTIKN